MHQQAMDYDSNQKLLHWQSEHKPRACVESCLGIVY